MNKKIKKYGFQYFFNMLEHFKGEEVFVKKILDYKDQVDYKQRLILTSFLDLIFNQLIRSIIGSW